MPFTHREVTRLGRELATRSHAVISRTELNRLGIDRYAVRTQVRTERWLPLGSKALRVLDAPWDDQLSPIVAATLNAPRSAWAEGTSALLLAGLKGWQAHEIDVGLPLGTNTKTVHATRIHRLSSIPSLRLTPVPHSPPATAAIYAAAWADTERQTAALLSMSVQQRLVTPQAIQAALTLMPFIRRRRLIHDVIGDITGGSESMGELDFLRECRLRGLPDPDRQVVRRGPNGRMYLDAFWNNAGLCVEIDGAHHYVGDMPTKDALRQNELALLSYTVIRIPRLALRTDADPFFEQIKRHLAR